MPTDNRSIGERIAQDDPRLETGAKRWGRLVMYHGSCQAVTCDEVAWMYALLADVLGETPKRQEDDYEYYANA